MTRGNQRDLARAKNQKKSQEQGKKVDDGLTPQQRRERDAKALAEKVKQKESKPKDEETYIINNISHKKCIAKQHNHNIITCGSQ
ncbi:unnamed protein product [Chironomus riparius]|uniref:Small EDRK-rich factor-like N-terminal domain-containing protein n=1 Tax=Chironomus riparius TaxID=315576 RepID=A0A9N9WLF4_9DIPT|nr:unnamed protein product [Chironomus riparius]